MRFFVGRVKQLVELTYDTIREPYHSLPLPAGLAKAMAAPREFLNKKVRSVVGLSLLECM